MSRPVILVVEDEALIMLMLADCLESHGYEVLTAPRAKAALEILDTRDDVDLLFTDIDLRAAVDGVTLSRLAREAHPDLAVIYTSGRFVGVSRDHAVDGSRFLPKPYRLPALLEEIEAVLGRRTPMRSPAERLRLPASSA